MKDTLNRILKIFRWIVLLFAFSSLGFLTDNPALMVPLYFLFFLLVFVLAYFYHAKRQKKKQLTGAVATKPAIVNKILGIILILEAAFTPSLFFSGVGFSFWIHLFLVLLTIILIAAAIFSIKLINKKLLPHTLIGYILLLLICSVPAFTMMQHDSSYHALGTAYYAALVIAVLAWFGITTLVK